MVLRLDENVQARDGLEQRGVGVSDAVDVGGREVEADRDGILSLAKKLTR